MLPRLLTTPEPDLLPGTHGPPLELLSPPGSPQTFVHSELPPPAATPQPPPKGLINPALFPQPGSESRPKSHPPLPNINPAWLHEKPPWRRPRLIDPALFPKQQPGSKPHPESRPPFQYINPAVTVLQKNHPRTRRHSPRPGHPAARAYVRDLLTTSIDDLD